MIKNHRYAFYGSLRKEMENHGPYAHDLKYLRTVELRGFAMYSLGEYPCAVYTGITTDKITAELFEITDTATEQNIYEMEIDAGYIFSEIQIAGDKFGIYLFESPGPHHIRVAGGDWRIFRESRPF